MASTGGTLKVPSQFGNPGSTGNNSMIHSPHQESTLLAPPVGGVILSSSRIPVQSNEGESADGASSSQRKVETHSVEDARSNGAFTMDGANNATIKTEGHLHHKHHHKHPHKNSAANSKNARKIQFGESEETEEDLKNMTEEELKLRKREANLMALVKRAANKSQASL
jgi:hypothetical protein